MHGDLSGRPGREQEGYRDVLAVGVLQVEVQRSRGALVADPVGKRSLAGVRVDQGVDTGVACGNHRGAAARCDRHRNVLRAGIRIGVVALDQNPPLPSELTVPVVAALPSPQSMKAYCDAASPGSPVMVATVVENDLVTVAVKVVA